jgi:hypothetical protein
MWWAIFYPPNLQVGMAMCGRSIPTDPPKGSVGRRKLKGKQAIEYIVWAKAKHKE